MTAAEEPMAPADEPGAVPPAGTVADPPAVAVPPAADTAVVAVAPVVTARATAAATPRRRRRRALAAVVIVLLPLLLVGAAAGGLVAWDAGYEGRILPGVHVGSTDLAGMDRAQASAALAAAYPYDEGRVVLRTPDGDITIEYGDVGRRPDVTTMVDRALASGRAGGPLERAVAEVSQALDGATIPPIALFDEARLADAITGALAALERDPVDAGITMGPEGPVTTAARAGRSVDPAPAVAAALAGIAGADAPPELVVPVATTEVPPAVDDEAVDIARIRATRLAADLRIGYGKKTWTIPAARIRTWVRFEVRSDGSVAPVVDTSLASGSLGAPTKLAARKPVNATFLRGRGGRVVGVAAGRDGRALDADATVARIAAELRARSQGKPGGARVGVITKAVAPKVTTEEARKTAPLMVRLGGWTTYFPISERNFFGRNIWRPAQLIDGTVLAPGQTFDWWRAIWPVTTARGFGPGGFIRSDHTDPTGALGGGMCSSSTTLFNAALRAGLRMGARSNHKYYITRYPLGLDATVSGTASGPSQTMRFTNDTRHAILIRAFRIRGSGGRGYVRYEIWGVPDGRTVSLTRPSVWNVRQATTKTVTVTTLPHGVRDQTEFPANGMDVSVTRIVRDAKGRIIRRDVYRSHYVLWNGRIEVGA